MKFELNTQHYLATHGRSPKGRGQWMIEVMPVVGPCYEPKTITAGGTLTEVRRHAERVARRDFPEASKVDLVVLP